MISTSIRSIVKRFVPTSYIEDAEEPNVGSDHATNTAGSRRQKHLTILIAAGCGAQNG
jgi:hypothetical protein